MNNKSTFFKRTSNLLLGFLIIAGIMYWSEGHDDAVAKSAQAYEMCVADKYHTTPSKWLAEHGNYLYCDPRPYLDKNLILASDGTVVEITD